MQCRLYICMNVLFVQPTRIDTVYLFSTFKYSKYYLKNANARFLILCFKRGVVGSEGGNGVWKGERVVFSMPPFKLMYLKGMLRSTYQQLTIFVPHTCATNHNDKMGNFELLITFKELVTLIF